MMLKDWRRHDIEVDEPHVSMRYINIHNDNIVEVRLDEVRVGTKNSDGTYTPKIIKHDFKNPTQARQWALEYIKKH